MEKNFSKETTKAAYTKEQIMALINKKRDRFDLEQDIMQCWNVVEDLDIFVREFVDGETPMTEDEVWNHVYGIREVYNARFEELWKTFESQLR